MRGRLRTAAGVAALAALAALTVVAAAPASRAQTTGADVVLADFKRLCLATGGDRAAALAAADKAGWAPAPADAMTVSAPNFQNGAGRLHTEGSGFQFLLVGDRPRSLGGSAVKLHACGVGGSVVEVARLEAAAQEIAGAPKAARLSDAQHSVWIFAEENGRHVPLDEGDARRIAAAADSGALRVLARQTRVTPGMPTGLTTLMLDTPAR